MRSREILANWLVCVATNAATEGELTFCSDPIGGAAWVFRSKSTYGREMHLISLPISASH
jgi:hypothetical protein